MRRVTLSCDRCLAACTQVEQLRSARLVLADDTERSCYGDVLRADLCLGCAVELREWLSRAPARH
jgi:hypothetical protein